MEIYLCGCCLQKAALYKYKHSRKQEVRQMREVGFALLIV